MSAAATSTPPDSIRAALLRPQLGLDHPKGEMSAKTGKHHELPLPPAPEEEKEEEEEEASSVWISVGVSAISLLGSAVVGVGSAVGSAALSVLTSSVESESRSATKTEAVSPTASETTLLGSMSATISGIASSTIDYATGGHTPQVPSSPSAQAHDAAAKKAKRASTLPIQLTATGEPFSSDPSISAMQRIPDHACGHTHHRQGLTHCCSAPDVLASAGSVEEGQCRCKCTEQAEGNEDPECECICHAKTKGQSGHFHRVEQLVKGTKRVVRDIKNVL